MSLTEKFDAAAAKMDELKDKLEKASEEVRKSWKDGIAEFKSDAAFDKACFDEIADEREAKNQAKKEERKEKFEETAEAVRESFAEGAANYKSDQEILKASLRDIAVEADEQTELAEAKFAEKKAEKVDAAREKVAAAKAKINEIEEAFDKADMEELIDDLLDYAEECQTLADIMTEEAELALKAAAQEIALYNEKYGE